MSPPPPPTHIWSRCARRTARASAASTRTPRLFSDLVELGVGHITVNISLRQKFGDGQVRQLDQLLTFAHENGIVVTAILLIPPRTPLLAHPDCDPSAHYALPDMTSAAGVEAFAASVRFLAERYCEPGAPNGRISHWIVGNEVDAGWVWTNAGEMGAEQYMRQYTRALRVAHYSVRSFDPHGKVYISLTHHWNSSHKPEPNRFYRPRHLLELLRDALQTWGRFRMAPGLPPVPGRAGQPADLGGQAGARRLRLATDYDEEHRRA